MVILYNFQEIYEVCSKTQVLNLPKLKENLPEIRYEDDVVFCTDYSIPSLHLPFADTGIYNFPICESKQLTAEDGDCKVVYEVTFDIKNSSFNFKPGDTIGIIPHNDTDSVNYILEHLDLTSKSDSQYHLSWGTSQNVKLPPHLPVKSSLKVVLTRFLDLRSVLKKLFLLSLSRHTKDERERKVLEYLCSREGSAAYNTHIMNKHFCILDLFTHFKSCKPPIEILLMNLPRLLPRPYSVLNSNLKNPDILKICFSVVELENNRKGLTTGWLENLSRESTIERKLEKLSLKEFNGVPIYLRKNITGFSMPEVVETPLILIGPGTGIAPFIGFLEERQYLKETKDIQLGKTWLFFGCRNPKLDFIYEKELKEYLDKGILHKLSTAFSRVEENNGVKYVQDAILQNAEDVAKWIKEGASIFVCGDVKKVAPQVKSAVQNCLIKNGDSEQEATDLLSDMVAKKKYLVDIWS